MKRKYLNGTDWDFVDSYSYKCIHIDDIFSGHISLLKVIKMKKRLAVDYGGSDQTLVDDGYKCIMFLPDNENWCASIGYNASNEVIEWYFDVTKQNSIDEAGNPFFDDLYLDIAVSPDYEVFILDEDELKEALELGVITKEDYQLAYNTCSRVIERIIPNKEFMIAFFEKYLHALEH